MERIGEVKRTVYEFEWSIPEFASLLTEDSRWYQSPSFEVLGKSCYFSIYPKYCRSSSPSMTQEDTPDYVLLYFFMDSSPQHPIVPEVSFAIRNAAGNKDQERHDPYQQLTPEHLLYTDYLFVSRAELVEQASELMPYNILTVICTVKCKECTDGISERLIAICTHCDELLHAEAIFFHEKNCYSKPVNCPECSKAVKLGDLSDHGCQSTKNLGEVCTFKPSAVPHENNALNDLKELFLQKEDCDVVLKVKDQDFPAHRNILKARSAVFASTFRTDMKEKATGVVEIDDCDPSCFSDFLCFIYCADVSLISQENVFGLFTAADKYNVWDLRRKCMEFMKENLSVDTFCDIMTLALLHSETELIELATDFFTKNASDIILTVKWQVFLAENPTQCNKLLVKLLKPSVKRFKR